MKLHINGEPRTFDAPPAPFTLSARLETLGRKPDRLAVELNRDIVSRDRWGQTQLQEGDQLEIVHFVGGGLGASFPWFILSAHNTSVAKLFLATFAAFLRDLSG